MNKFLKWLVGGFAAASLCGTLAACGGGAANEDGANDEPRYELSLDTVYAMAESAGYTGTLDELVEMFKGDSVTTAKLVDGNLIVTLSNGAEINCGRVVGEKGQDGATPEITVGKDGHWYINGQNTGVKAKGEDGEMPEIDIDDNGHWTINGKNTGVLAKGQDGKDGSVVTIENGNWYIDGKDTGVSAIASKGSDGENGTDGKDGNGIASVERVKTENLVDTYKITYTDKDKEPTYFTVTNARSISYMEIKDGVLWAYYNDGTSDELGKVVGEDGEDGENGANGEDGATPSVEIVDGFWYVNGENTGYRAECDCESGGNTVVEEETVTVTFETGFNLPVPQRIVHKGDSIEDLPVPEFTGYEFQGWFVGEGPNAGQVTVVTPISRDMTLVAKWATETTIQIVSNVNRVTLGDWASFRVEYTGTVDGLDVSVFDEEGYDFAVLQTVIGKYPNGKKYIQYEIEPTEIGIQTFSIRYKTAAMTEAIECDFLVTVEESYVEPEETFTVTFERFSGEKVSEVVEKGSEVEILAPQEINGYEFVGWYEQNTGRTYYQGETVYVESDLYFVEKYNYVGEEETGTIRFEAVRSTVTVGETAIFRIVYSDNIKEFWTTVSLNGVNCEAQILNSDFLESGERYTEFGLLVEQAGEFTYTVNCEVPAMNLKEASEWTVVVEAKETPEPTEYNVTFTVYYTNTGDYKTFSTVVGEMTVGEFYNDKIGYAESEYTVEKIDMVVDGSSYSATFDYIIESDCEITFYVKPVETETTEFTVSYTLMNANTFEEIGTFEAKISEEMTVRDFFDKYVGDEYILWEILVFVGEEQRPAGQLNSVITQDCRLELYVEYVGLDEFLRISVDEDIPVGETAGFRVDWRGFTSVEHGIYQDGVQLSVSPIDGVEERLWSWYNYEIPVAGTFEIRVTATRADGTQRVESGYITAYAEEPAEYAVTFKVWYTDLNEEANVTFEPTLTGESTVRTYYEILCQSGQVITSASVLDGVVVVVGEERLSVELDYVLTEACTVYFLVNYSGEVVESTEFEVAFAIYYVGTEDSKSFTVTQYGEVTLREFYDARVGYGDEYIVEEIVLIIGDKVTSVDFGYVLTEACTVHFHVKAVDYVEYSLQVGQDTQRLPVGKSCGFIVSWSGYTMEEITGEIFKDGVAYDTAPSDYIISDNYIWYSFTFTEVGVYEFRFTAMKPNGDQETLSSYLTVYEDAVVEEEIEISFEAQKLVKGENAHFSVTVPEGQSMGQVRVWTSAYIPNDNFWVESEEEIWNDNGQRIKVIYHYAFTPEYSDVYRVEVMPESGEGLSVDAYIEVTEDGVTDTEYAFSTNVGVATVNFGEKFEFTLYLTGFNAADVLRTVYKDGSEYYVEWYNYWVDENNNPIYEATFYESGSYEIHLTAIDPNGIYHQVVMKLAVVEQEPEKISHAVLTKEIMLGEAAQIELSVYEGYILQSVTVRSSLDDEYEVSTEQLDAVDGYAKYLASFYPDTTGDYYINITCLDGEAMKPIEITVGGHFYLLVVDENGNEVVKSYLSWGYVEEEIYVGKPVSFWVKTNASNPYEIVYTIATPDHIYTLSAAQESAGIISYYSKYDNGFEAQFVKAGEYTIGAEYDGTSVTTTVVVKEYVFDGEVEVRGYNGPDGVAFLGDSGVQVELVGEFYAPENAEISLLINGKTVEELTAEKTLVESEPLYVGWSFGELRVEAYLNILVAGNYEFVLAVDGGEFGEASLEWSLDVIESVEYAEPTRVAFDYDEYASQGREYRAMLLVYLPSEYRNYWVDGAVSVNGGEYSNAWYEYGNLYISFCDIGNGYYSVDLYGVISRVGTYTLRLALLCDGQVCVESEEWSISIVREPSFNGMGWEDSLVVGCTSDMRFYLNNYTGELKGLYLNGLQIPTSGFVETEYMTFEVNVVYIQDSALTTIYFNNAKFLKAGEVEIALTIEFMGEEMTLENSFEIETFDSWIELDNEFVIGEETSGKVEFVPVGAVENAYLVLGEEVMYETSGTFTYSEERYGNVVGTGTYEYVYNKETGILEFTLLVEKGQEVGRVYVSYVAVVDGEEYHGYENRGWSTTDLVYFDVDSYFEVGASDNESYLYIATDVENVSFSINGSQAADGVCTGEDWGMVTYIITKLESGATLISFPQVNALEYEELHFEITATVGGVERTQEYDGWMDSEGSIRVERQMVTLQLGAYAYALENYYPTEVYEEYKDFAAICKEISENADTMPFYELMAALNDSEIEKFGEELSEFAISFEEAKAVKADMVSKFKAWGIGEGVLRWYMAAHVGLPLDYCNLGELTEEEYEENGSYSYLYYALYVITFEGRDTLELAEEIYASSPMMGMSLTQAMEMFGMTAEEVTALEESRNAYFGLSESATTEESEAAKAAYLAQIDEACNTLYQILTGDN